jgi:reverse gyrase
MKSGFVQKRCPKCGGNIYLDRDYSGWYEQCLQCSHTCYLETIVEVHERLSSKGNLGQAEGSALTKTKK